MRKQNGFTLVELLVAITCASIVTFAAASLLLFGTRASRLSQDQSSQQNTARVMTQLLEKLASEGDVTRVETLGRGWALYGEDEDAHEREMLRYSAAEQAILVGETALMENVQAASAVLDEHALLTFTIQSEGNTYETAIFCRTGALREQAETMAEQNEEIREEILLLAGKTEQDWLAEEAQKPAEISPLEMVGRYDLLNVLWSQLGSMGRILPGGEYFAKWYSGGQWGSDGWNAQTPWCGCFVSWGVNQCSSCIQWDAEHPLPQYASVDKEGNDETWKKHFVDAGTWKTDGPIPGDLVLFDWEEDGEADHIGAVLAVRDEVLYTVEGNTSGTVAVRTYALTDPRIVGYGVLPWRTGT